MIKRASKTLPIGEGGSKNILVFTSDDCEPDSNMSTVFMVEMLNMVSNNPSVVYCRNKTFDKLTLSHDGERWVLQAENVTYD
jgi:hypothetical protein